MQREGPGGQNSMKNTGMSGATQSTSNSPSRRATSRAPSAPGYATQVAVGGDEDVVDQDQEAGGAHEGPFPMGGAHTNEVLLLFAAVV